jgi:hypothetical protein
VSNLSLITDWQSEVWLDSVSFYTPVKDAQNNTIGVTLQSGPYACNWINTPNYDLPSTVAGQSKEDNIFTSNHVRLQIEPDVLTKYYAKITSRSGYVEWMKVNGAPKNRWILGYAMVFLIPPAAGVVDLTP